MVFRQLNHFLDAGFKQLRQAGRSRMGSLSGQRFDELPRAPSPSTVTLASKIDARFEIGFGLAVLVQSLVAGPHAGHGSAVIGHQDFFAVESGERC